jgi:hypothetical protein
MANRKALAVSFLAATLFAMAFAVQGDGFKRERTGSTAAAKDAIEGKKAPALQVSEWLNTSAGGLMEKDLKGKIVVVDFWAFW